MPAGVTVRGVCLFVSSVTPVGYITYFLSWQHVSARGLSRLQATTENYNKEALCVLYVGALRLCMEGHIKSV
jgi:hypothetical protein